MRFSFYTVDTPYCNYLRKFDSKVPHTMDKKSSKPFVGIIFSIKDFKDKAWKSLADRCCNFSEDEKRCNEYFLKHRVIDSGEK